MDSHLAWYTARAAGLVAWSVCAAAMALGLLQAGRVFRRRGAPAWVNASHRYVGSPSVVFVLIHVVSLGLHHYVGFGLADLTVPLHSPWKPVPLAWGIVGLHLVLASQVTSYLRAYLPRCLWRWFHSLSFPLVAAATAHAYQAGTDRTNQGVLGVFVAGAVFVVGALALRINKVADAATA